MLKQDQYIQGRLVEMGWRFGKAYGGHMAGQLVMCTLANRVRKGWGSWLQVIDNVPKFMAENELPPLEHPSLWEPGFVKMLHAVDGIYDGSVVDLSKGATYWADLAHVERPWFKTAIIDSKDPLTGLPRYMRVVDMNSLSFWTEFK